LQALEPQNAKTQLYLSIVLLEQHKTDVAAACGRALALDPKDHDALNLVGRIVFERNDLDGALMHFCHDLAMKPYLADAPNNIGNALKGLGKLDEALKAYLKALALNLDVTSVYINYADALA
jgi:superkiller protein 3